MLLELLEEFQVLLLFQKYLHFVVNLHMDVLDLDLFDNTNWMAQFLVKEHQFSFRENVL